MKQCPMCEKYFSTAGKILKNHFLSHKREERVKAGLVPAERPPRKICSICGRDFFDHTSLRRHMLYHSGKEYKYEKDMDPETLKRKRTCTICGKYFPSVSRCTEHMKDHGEKVHFCHKCSAGFAVLWRLKKHMKYQHGEHLNPENHRFMCMECGKTFEGIGHLKNHMKAVHKLTTEEILEKLGSGNVEMKNGIAG